MRHSTHRGSRRRKRRAARGPKRHSNWPSTLIGSEELPLQCVEVSFVRKSRVERTQRASGVSEVEVDCALVRSLVWATFWSVLKRYQAASS